MAKRSTSKRELIDTGRNKMFAKQDVQGRFKEMDDAGRSLATDRRTAAETARRLGMGITGSPASGEEDDVAIGTESAAMGRLAERFARRAAERRVPVEGDRRQRGRGDRRRTDRGRPWWQKGLVVGVVLAILRWRFFPPDRS